jgi:hypothetical protein
MNFDLSNFFKKFFEIQCEIHNFFNYILLYKKLVEISKIENIILCNIKKTLPGSPSGINGQDNS